MKSQLIQGPIDFQPVVKRVHYLTNGTGIGLLEIADCSESQCRNLRDGLTQPGWRIGRRVYNYAVNKQCANDYIFGTEEIINIDFRLVILALLDEYGSSIAYLARVFGCSKPTVQNYIDELHEPRWHIGVKIYNFALSKFGYKKLRTLKMSENSKPMAARDGQGVVDYLNELAKDPKNRPQNVLLTSDEYEKLYDVPLRIAGDSWMPPPNDPKQIKKVSIAGYRSTGAHWLGILIHVPE